ncbi:MAG TPA: class I SAM-dependent methyltransferase [Desulfomonilaceae bacterium]|nr:class I SAM-dependent methyltransferase [Desulfomonilaceae bacterium]
MAKHVTIHLQRVCPWWVGYFLISPIRRWLQNPEKILAPYINEGMTVLEIGPGMGFFTIPAARMVGESGKVIAVDVQEKMLTVLRKRAEKAGVADRVVTKRCKPDNIGVSDPIDLCLVINVAHEVPDAAALFGQIRAILKPTARVLLSEPGGWHISEEEFQETLAVASAQGLKVIEKPKIPRSRSALLALKRAALSQMMGSSC